MAEQEPRQKYKFTFQIKEDKKTENNLNRRTYFDPDNPYQLIKTILLTKLKKRKN